MGLLPRGCGGILPESARGCKSFFYFSCFFFGSFRGYFLLLIDSCIVRGYSGVRMRFWQELFLLFYVLRHFYAPPRGILPHARHFAPHYRMSGAEGARASSAPFNVYCEMVIRLAHEKWRIGTRFAKYVSRRAAFRSHEHLKKTTQKDTHI